jgi:hypothetical protein
VYVPAAVSYKYALSARAKTAKPTATNAQVASNRQPVRANVATTSASRSTSASG